MVDPELSGEKKFATYWANTSSNRLISKLIREGSMNTKTVMEDLIRGKIKIADDPDRGELSNLYRPQRSPAVIAFLQF